jgi:hypothetical protein
MIASNYSGGSFDWTQVSKLGLFNGFSSFNFYFLYAPRPNSLFQVRITIAMAMFLSFGDLFLDCLLKLVQFFAQMCKRLLCGIRFLSTFIGGTEIVFLRSVFLVPTTTLCVVRGIHAPIFHPEVAMLLGTSFLGDSGHRLSTRSVVSSLDCALDFSLAHMHSIVLRDMRSERMSMGVLPFL